MTNQHLPMLLQEFLHATPDAQMWLEDDFSEAPDCDVIAHLFLGWALGSGILAQNVTVRMNSPYEATLDEHVFTVLDNGTAIDWTARQFHNCEGMPLEADQIPVPLIFLWPGDYPLPDLIATELKRWPEQ